MSEKSESEDFEDEELDESGDDADVALDKAIKDLDLAKRRSQKGGAEPIWRRLERLQEDRRTAELTRDLDDYDLDDEVLPRR